MIPVRINPSILAADMGRLRDDCRRIEDAGADEVHVDVMDGIFVPNISFGPAVTAMARKAVSIPLNVHLMILRPGLYVDAFAEAGANTLLIHIESEGDPAEILGRIRAAGMRPGIVLNPQTPLERIRPVLPLVDEVLFMTVNPGFGGQSFLADQLPNIQALRREFPQLALAVDGGLNRDTCLRCRQQGANVFDIGSHLFKPADMAAEITALRALLA
jgi:ribulose-phosphate 3-epimerase